MYSINLTERNKKLCLSWQYNGANSYLFINGNRVHKSKAKRFWNCSNSIMFRKCFKRLVSRYYKINWISLDRYAYDFVLSMMQFLLKLYKVFILWHHGVVVITNAQLHSAKPELRFCTGSNPALACCVGDLWWWGSLTMVPTGNKEKRLSSVNHTTKTIHHHH